MKSPFATLLMIAGLVAVDTARAAAAGVALGDTPKPFALPDAATGKEVRLDSVHKGKALVLMFIATQCPVSNAYNERMAALARDYVAKEVNFVGINSNKQEPPSEITEHAKKHGFTFPVLKDAGNVEADHFGATVTPEVFVLDADWKLRYHGRIDDDRSGEAIKSRDLRNALDAILSGQKIAVPETKAFGCTIKRVTAANTP